MKIPEDGVLGLAIFCAGSGSVATWLPLPQIIQAHAHNGLIRRCIFKERDMKLDHMSLCAQRKIVLTLLVADQMAVYFVEKNKTGPMQAG